jgi:hypothetical protein
MARSLLVLPLAAALLALPAVGHAQDTLPPGTLVAEAIAADLPEAGLDFIVGEFTGLIPPDLIIGSIPSQELIDLFLCTEDFWLDNLIVHTTVNAITSDGQSPATYPPDGALVVNVDVTLSINDPVDTATLTLDGCIDYVCNLHTTPADVQLSLPVTLRMAQDQNGDDYVDIEFGDLVHNIQQALAGTIFLTGCAVGDIDAFLNNNLGFSVFDLVIGQFVGQIEQQIADALTDLEVTGEDALRALWLEDTTAILDTELQYEIQPNAIDHNDDGLRLVLAGRTATEPHPCVAQFALDGSLLTNAPIPPMSASVPSNNAVYHLGAMLADDFANQAMFSLWNGGVMCFVVTDADVSGFTIDSTLFGLLGGQDAPDLFEQFFPFGPQPMVIRTLPENPPTVRFDGPNDINVSVEGLNVQFVPLILDRFSNLVTVAIDIDAGIDVSIAPDGALALDIFLDTEDLNPRVTYNELDPSSNAIVEQNFGTLVGAVINLVAGDLLSGMKIALPTLGGSPAGDDDDSAGDDDDSAAGPTYGLGAVQLDMEAVGLSSSLLDFLGAYILLGDSWGGESSGGCGDCGGAGGCGDCGGEGGCGSCGDLAGCDIQQELEDSGCSGETSGQPNDLGCQGCRMGTGVHKVGANHWRIELDAAGATVAPHPHQHRRRGPHPVTMLLILLPIAWTRRRR